MGIIVTIMELIGKSFKKAPYFSSAFVLSLISLCFGGLGAVLFIVIWMIYILIKLPRRNREIERDERKIIIPGVISNDLNSNKNKVGRRTPSKDPMLPGTRILSPSFDSPFLQERPPGHQLLIPNFPLRSNQEKEKRNYPYFQNEEYDKYVLTTVSNECSICLLEFTDDTQIIMLPCDIRHFFHDVCILDWFGKIKNCPICCAEFPNITISDPMKFSDIKSLCN